MYLEGSEVKKKKEQFRAILQGIFFSQKSIQKINIRLNNQILDETPVWQLFWGLLL